MVTKCGICAINSRKVMRALCCSSCIYCWPLHVSGMYVLTDNFIADPCKLDLVISFESFKETLLSYPSLEEDDTVSPRYNI